jgi:hypothetical protein
VDGSAEVLLTVESECSAIRRLAAGLTRVNPWREFTYRGEGPLTFQEAARHCSHAACMELNRQTHPGQISPVWHHAPLVRDFAPLARDFACGKFLPTI